MHKCKQAYLHFTQMRNVIHFVQPRVKNRLLMTHIHKQKALFKKKKSLPCRLSVVIIVRVLKGFQIRNQCFKALSRDRTTDNEHSNCSLHEQTAFPAPVSVHLTLNTSLGAKLYGSSLANKRHFLLRTLLICVRVCAHKCALYRCDFLMWSSRWKCFSMADSCHVSVFQTNEKFIEEKSPQMRLQFIEYCLAP